MCPFCWYLLCAVRQIVEEAGGAVTRMDGEAFSVFDRSVIVSNGHLHSQVRCHSQEGVQEGGGGLVVRANHVLLTLLPASCCYSGSVETSQ